MLPAGCGGGWRLCQCQCQCKVRVSAITKSVPAPSSLAARSDKEVGGGANEEVDDEAAARTGKVRAAARRSHFTQSRAG